MQAPVVLTALTHLSHRPQKPIVHSTSGGIMGPLLSQAVLSVVNKCVCLQTGFLW